MTKFSVPLKPTVKSRPRVTIRGTYNDPRYEDWKSAARAYALAAWAKDQLTGPISMEITLFPDHFEVEIELATTEVVKVRGDVDNLAGAVLDCLQPKKKVINGKRRHVTGGVIADDAQVVSLFVRKASIDEKPFEAAAEMPALEKKPKVKPTPKPELLT